MWAWFKGYANGGWECLSCLRIHALGCDGDTVHPGAAWYTEPANA